MVLEPGADRATNAAVDADNSAVPAWVLEAAAQAVAAGSPLPSVARFYDVPESRLQEWIASEADRAASDPAAPRGDGHAGAMPPEALASDVTATEPVAAEIMEVPSSRSAAAPQMSVAASNGAQTEPNATATLPQPASARYIPAVYASARAVTAKGSPSHHSPTGFLDFVQLLRRRFLVVVVGLVLGLSAGWLTAPGESRRESTFLATHTLIYEPDGDQAYNIDQVALLATSGEVPSRVAARFKLDRGQVRSAVSAEAKTDVSTISITGQSSDAAAAVSLADVTAEELAAAIHGTVQASYQAEVDRLTIQVETARNRLNAVPSQNSAAQAQAQASLDTAEGALEQYKSSQAPKLQLRTLEAATAIAVTPAGVQAPSSKPIRAGLVGIFGLLSGVAGAVALDRLDRRIRSKNSAEEAFGVPVVAEVPPISKSSQGQLLARTQPSSPVVEAYRGLRTFVALWAPEADKEDGHRVIVVTSPAAGEGKTTTVAHLAAMLAEIGRSVLVVSADLRRPQLHHYFDVSPAPGLVDALSAISGSPSFAGLDQATPVRGVRILPSGAAIENPAPLFEHAESLIRSVRGLADFVLVDAPPLLVANDAVEMARFADGVLMVARAGETPIEAAQRSAETLGRLEIPVVGTVLVASEAASSASRYYASRYYAEPERTRRRRRRPPTVNGQDSPAPHEAPPAVGDQ